MSIPAAPADPRDAAAPAPASWRRPLALLQALLAPVGQTLGSVFFIPQPWIGLLLVLALATTPRHLAFALAGLLVGAAANRLLGFADTPGGGGVQANALLGAVVMGWMTGSFGLSWSAQLLLAALAAVLSALLAAALRHALARSALPVVLLGYCALAAMLFAICPQCTVAAANQMPAWPQLADARGWGESLLRSLGALMYGQDALSGAVVALAVLLWSRAQFACGIAGWAGGALAAIGFQQLHLTYYWLPLSYNFFIAGSALGAALLLPGRWSLPVAALAGALASFFGLALQAALQGSSTSYLPLSSALAIWVGLGALAAVGQRPVHSAAQAALPPEQLWWRWAYWRERFGEDVPLFAAPVAGEVLVSQGFDGGLSHRDAQRHALDLERPRGPGAALGSILGSEVLSPVAGTVERVCNHVADNPPGVCNYIEPWGNHVVVRLDGSESWALLAHLQQGSVAVLPGARVEQGSYLGRVGNSGRSTFAHLHLQLQSGPQPGSPTRAFKLANYLRVPAGVAHARPWIVSGVPAEGEVVSSAPANAAVYQALAGLAPGTGVWTVETAGQVPRAFREPGEGRGQRLHIRLDGLGRHVFSAAHGGSLVASLDPDAWRVVEVSGDAAPLLRLIALAVPTIPYAARAGMAWNDLPPLLPQGALRRALALLLAPYGRRPFVRVASACVAEPGPQGPLLEIRSHLDPQRRNWPTRLVCMCSALKGPVRIRADFAGGSVTYSLLSYEPGDPRAPASR